MVGKSHNISFNDLSLRVGRGQEKKVILNKISGAFPSGKLIGILGPSGAGKTSLLNILSGWDQFSNISGNINVNDEPRKWNDFKSISCYITQDSHLNNGLTTMENMKFAADLKLGPRLPQFNKDSLINKILASFGLSKCNDTMTSGLSGGQRKRLAICLELLRDPDIVFLDEPTTGLDIVSMFQCMRYLRNLSSSGKTIVCTLHQPPDQIFELLDIIYIVSQGQCAYQGGPKELIPFLEHSGVPCEIFHSPLDFIIEIASGAYGEKPLDAIMKTSRNGQNHDYLPVFEKTVKQRKRIIKRGRTFANWRNYSPLDDFYEFRSLLHREFVKARRDIFFAHFRILGLLINNIISGIVAYNMGPDASMHYFNYNVVLLHVGYHVLICALFSNVSFALNQNVIYNEYQNRYYSIWNYYIVCLLLDLPVIFIASSSSSCMVYWLSGQYWELNRVLMFAFISFETALISSSFGFLFGTILDFNKSIFLVSSIHIPILALSGFGISMNDIPSYFKFATYIVYSRYTVRGLMNAVFGYDRPLALCPDEELYCHYKDSKKFLDDMGLEDYYFFYDATALIGFFIVIRGISYVLLRLRLKGRLHFLG